MSDAAPTNLLGPGTRFEGLLTFRDGVRIDGVLKGEVVGRGRLVLGPTAEVEAAIDVDVLVLGGRLSGPVRARQRAELLDGSVLEGSLATPVLSISEGAILEGRCITGPDALAETAEAPTPDPAEVPPPAGGSPESS